ncbi:MAG TPA: metallophosphoesterase [Acidobacteriota bacterium]|nr:metallophosphoesterase [Acidobacteriota bacterium]
MRPRRGLLVVSDLHLGAGVDPNTGLLSRHEDFLFDEEFAAFLDHHRSDALWSEVEWTLIIAGDFIDFLQVTDLPSPPGSEEEVPAAGSGLRSDPTYGLKAGPKESAWKLSRVAEGHPRTFRALAEFAQTHRVVIISGNHDAEFVFPEVRTQLQRELGRCLGKSGSEFADTVEFNPWFYLEDGVYVEHGHQYDSWNSFRFVLDPRLAATQGGNTPNRNDLELPLGTLFVRYVFNRVELDLPFADNLKPARRFLLWFALFRPWSALRFFLRDGCEMLRRIRRKWTSPEGEAQESKAATPFVLEEGVSQARPKEEGRWSSRDIALMEELNRLAETPVLSDHHSLKRRIFRRLTGPVVLPTLIVLALAWFGASLLQVVRPFLVFTLPAPLASQLDTLWGRLPAHLQDFLLGSFWLFAGLTAFSYRRLQRPDTRLRDRLRERSAAVRRVAGCSHVIMGHTHDADRLRDPQGAYFNCGTWTKVFSPEERVIREEKELTFVRLLRIENGWRGDLMRWEGIACDSRPALVFRDR